jgi:hypothetical protein
MKYMRQLILNPMSGIQGGIVAANKKGSKRCLLMGLLRKVPDGTTGHSTRLPKGFA